MKPTSTTPSAISTTPQHKSPQGYSTTSTWILLILIVVAAFGIRVFHLDADPPSWYIPTDQGFHIDEGYKTFAAKNLLVFGTSHWNPQDTYRGWLANSPITQYSYYAAFNAWGLELASARLVSVGFFTLFIIIFCIVAMRFWGPSTALLGAIMLSLDPALYHFSRVALFESALILVIFTAILSLSALPKNRRFTAMAVLAFAAFFASYLIKMSALMYLAPACAIIALVGVLERHQLTKCQYIAFALLLAGFSITIYLYRGIWIWRLALVEVLQAPQLLFWNHLTLLSPLLSICAYCCIIHTIADRPSLIKDNLYRLALVATLIGVPIILSVFSYSPPRYYVPIAPAAILLIADWMRRRHSSEAKPLNQMHPLQIAAIIMLLMMIVMHFLRVADFFILRPLDPSEEPGISKAALTLLFLVPAAVVLVLTYVFREKIDDRLMKHATLGALAGYLVFSITLTGRGALMPSYDSQVVRAALERHVTPEQSVAGGWAPFFAAESVIPSLYMNVVVNHPDRVEITRPDFFIYSGIANDWISLTLLQNNPRILLDPPIELGTYHFRDIQLYGIHYPSMSPGE
jgi:hypothetical protein